MKQRFGAFLMVFGAVLIPLIAYGTYWLIAMGCGMNTTGCSQTTGAMIMIVFIFWPFWVLLFIALSIIWIGWRLSRVQAA
ncbi:MAG: hypothetical protein EP336_13720 [Rhodobacteraceae bacterium]|nr:MAG: hypothetical protein EP336_13720 [Paracoccaceae bacterium]